MNKKTDNPPDFNELEQAFYDDGYRIAMEYLNEEDYSDSLLSAMNELYRSLNSFIDLFLENARKKNTPEQCKKGCAFCCHQAVFAQTYEFRFLKEWLFRNLASEDIEYIRTKAKERIKITKTLDSEKKLVYKGACPLLKDNECLVYEARPVACRIYLSMDLETCKYDYMNPGDKTYFPKLFESSLNLGRRLNEGFAARLEELGLTVDEFTIEEGLLQKALDTET